MPIRVVLADDHYLVREGVQRLLEPVSDVEVAAVCNDLDSLLDAVDAKRPDVVVTDPSGIFLFAGYSTTSYSPINVYYTGRPALNGPVTVAISADCS